MIDSFSLQPDGSRSARWKSPNVSQIVGPLVPLGLIHQHDDAQRRISLRVSMFMVELATEILSEGKSQ
jgi:hypothetical protein